MSTLTPTPHPASPPRDTAMVRHFRTAAPDEFLPVVNADLGLRLDAKTFLRLQGYFKNTALRDPGVGELRLLDALHRSGLHAPTRIAVGELTTESEAIAQTWADMMAKHGALHGVGERRPHEKVSSPPCTLMDALSLTGRYLYRAGLRDEEDTVLLSAPWQEPIAASEGYVPVARVAVSDRARTVWTRKAPPLEGIPPHTGDFILYLPAMGLHRAQALVASEAERSRPILGEIRAVAQKSLLLTVLELAPAVDLYASRLLRENESDPGRLPLAELCSLPTVEADGICGYLLRVPLKQVQTVNLSLKELGLSAMVLGQVRTGRNSVIYLRDPESNRDTAVATLPTELMRAAAGIGLYSMNPTSSAEDPDTSCQNLPPLARFPSAVHAENGLTPDGHETVALTLHEGSILRIPEADLLMTAVTATVSHTHDAFKISADTVASAANLLGDFFVPSEHIRLSVELKIASPQILTDGTALAAICGVYCAAAQLGVPVEDSIITTAPPAVPLQITVTAWAQDTETCAEFAAVSADDRQWHTTGQDQPAGKESVGYLLPVLRRSYEDSLKALSAAFNRNRRARCLILPLAMKVTETEDPDRPDYSLDRDSVAQLAEQLLNWNIPVISMSYADTRLLLSEPAVREALERRMDMGYSVLVLGESCRVFAEWGFLPHSLLELRSLADPPTAATVTYSIPAEPAVRLLRTPPLVPASLENASAEPHILTLRLPDGTQIPDGFMGRGGRVLGLLNGLDTAVLPCLQALRFHLPSIQ